MSNAFPHLFSPLTIRSVRFKNRILSTGHDTSIPNEGVVNERLIAYHQARAEGGAGLIVVQVAAIHASAHYTTHVLQATSDDCIAGYRRLGEVCHRYDCKVFAQLFHPGREVIDLVEGAATVAYAPSAVPSERFHVVPRAMTREFIAEVVSGFGDAARRMQRAGLDGVEIVASHGYLPAQFLNPRVNVRDDDYAGSLDNRLRFVREVVADIRAKTDDLIIGLRISGDEKDDQGLNAGEVLAACVALDGDADVDYFNVIAGTSATLGGAIHIVPPMAVDTGYVAPYASAVKARVTTPVMVAGRINQPQIAEQVLATGQADMCGMTRAMICDPEMANKAATGRSDDIRACIGCNQACIGHFHLGFPISCIQHPETGRELIYGTLAPASQAKHVMVIGGGPGGMKAAAVAAARGFNVTLYEREVQLGGQALIAQLLPGRAEFGGIVTNLSREVELAGVRVVKSHLMTPQSVLEAEPDVVIVATGAKPRWPDLVGDEEAHVVDAWQVLRNQVNVGNAVVVADWRSDWVGLGVAEKLARDGCSVRLYVTANMAGESIHRYVRDEKLGILHSLGVQIVPMVRLYGADGDSVYFQHVANGEAVIAEAVDTLVLAQGHVSVDTMVNGIAGYAGRLIAIGDCLSPRTAEEAVLEGLKAAAAL